jgi:N-acetylglucosamine-6-sulfatase
MANVLLITADDMRADELAFMPNTRRLLCGKGTTFTGCRANVPLCSPARAGILTGQLSKHHGGVTQGWSPNDTSDDNLFARCSTTHRIGVVGKYISGLAGQNKPSWATFWRCLNGSGGPTGLIYDAYGYTIRTEAPATITPTEFQDHYLAKQAVNFIEGSEPWVLWYCPTTNHWPWDDPPNHQTDHALTSWPLVLEADASDKPTWIQAQANLTPTEQAEMQDDQRHRLRELLALDDAIAAMVGQIDATGQADDTTIIFTSDNGNMLGEHRIQGTAAGSRAIQKNNLYDPALRVPLVCRGPGFVRQTVRQPTIQQDITRTVLAICGKTASLPNQAGLHLAVYATDPAVNNTRKLLHDRDTLGDGDGTPSADGITTYESLVTPGLIAPRKLIRNRSPHNGNPLPSTDIYEMYDLDVDPDEHTNVAYQPGRLAERNLLEGQLNLLLA